MVPIGNDPAGQWLESSIRFSVDEVNRGGAGSGLVLAKLSEVLLVETLRRHINALPAIETGWLAGARDLAIGRALVFLHKEPAIAWTVSSLAKRCGLSRTQFAARFRHFLGQSPIAYLTHWRLTLGAELLRSTEDGVAEVASSVGYCSEAAFNRAFKRLFKCPPAQFRREHKAQALQRPQRKSTPRTARGE